MSLIVGAIFSFIYSPLQIPEHLAVLYSVCTMMALALFHHATAGEMLSHDNSVSPLLSVERFSALSRLNRHATQQSVPDKI